MGRGSPPWLPITVPGKFEKVPMTRCHPGHSIRISAVGPVGILKGSRPEKLWGHQSPELEPERAGAQEGGRRGWGQRARPPLVFCLSLFSPTTRLWVFLLFSDRMVLLYLFFPFPPLLSASLSSSFLLLFSYFLLLLSTASFQFMASWSFHLTSSLVSAEGGQRQSCGFG